jgi:hypothetical protein
MKGEITLLTGFNIRENPKNKYGRRYSQTKEQLDGA